MQPLSLQTASIRATPTARYMKVCFHCVVYRIAFYKFSVILILSIMSMAVSPVLSIVPRTHTALAKHDPAGSFPHKMCTFSLAL